MFIFNEFDNLMNIKKKISVWRILITNNEKAEEQNLMQLPNAHSLNESDFEKR